MPVGQKRPRAAAHNLLKDAFPELEAEFVRVVDHPDRTFHDLAVCSKLKCEWICRKATCERKCLHPFIAPVQSRTRRTTGGCPWCSRQKTCVCNSLATKFPNLAQEYCSDNVRKVTETPPFSDERVKWKCQNTTCDHHVWFARISSRTCSIRASNCPFCMGRQICACYNFATEFPDLATSFDMEKNAPVTPDQFLPFSNKKAWWICRQTAVVHSWCAAVASRSKGHGCPVCRISKMEQTMETVLVELQQQKFIQGFVRDQPFLDTLLRPDFLVTLTPQLRLVIEMDGIQHFEPVSFGCSRRDPQEMLQKTQKLDQCKKELCEKYCIPLLRISFRVPKEQYAHCVKEFVTQCVAAPGAFHFQLVDVQKAE